MAIAEFSGQRESSGKASQYWAIDGASYVLQ
jgi:hypothetical protein